jgi:hypothetical protein
MDGGHQPKILLVKLDKDGKEKKVTTQLCQSSKFNFTDVSSMGYHQEVS